MKTHQLKIHPEYYAAQLDGIKPWEFRKNDRDYQVGDHLFLNEYDPSTDKFTGRVLEKEVVYLYKLNEFVIMTTQDPSKPKTKGVELIAWWNRIAPDRKIKAMPPARLAKWRNRVKVAKTALNLATEDELMDAIEWEYKSVGEFIKTGTWFGFDWLVNSDTNLAKFLEGRYRDKQQPGKKVEVL